MIRFYDEPLYRASLRRILEPLDARNPRSGGSPSGEIRLSNFLAAWPLWLQHPSLPCRDSGSADTHSLSLSVRRRAEQSSQQPAAARHTRAFLSPTHLTLLSSPLSFVPEPLSSPLALTRRPPPSSLLPRLSIIPRVSFCFCLEAFA